MAEATDVWICRPEPWPERIHFFLGWPAGTSLCGKIVTDCSREKKSAVKWIKRTTPHIHNSAPWGDCKECIQVFNRDFGRPVYFIYDRRERMTRRWGEATYKETVKGETIRYAILKGEALPDGTKLYLSREDAERDHSPGTGKIVQIIFTLAPEKKEEGDVS